MNKLLDYLGKSKEDTSNTTTNTNIVSNKDDHLIHELDEFNQFDQISPEAHHISTQHQHPHNHHKENRQEVLEMTKDMAKDVKDIVVEGTENAYEKAKSLLIGNENNDTMATNQLHHGVIRDEYNKK
jgi:hypothetical protein